MNKLVEAAQRVIYTSNANTLALIKALGCNSFDLHPAQHETFPALLKALDELKQALSEHRAEPSADVVFKAIFNHTITRHHNMTGRECKELAKATISAMQWEGI